MGIQRKMVLPQRIKHHPHRGATDTYPNGRIRPVYGAINSERLPAYHRLDLRADFALSKQSRIYFDLINAYNRENVEGYVYNADYTARRPVYQMPMMISIGYQAKF